VNEWTIQKLIQWTTQHFGAKGIESSRLDAELLLAHTLNCKRLDLYLKFDQPVSTAELASFKNLVMRRTQREPVAYILGRQEFFSYSFDVSPGVLIPRPETEHLLEEALSWAKLKSDEKISILDIGSGSGAIGVTLAIEDPRIHVTALDISEKASRQTSTNAKKFDVLDRVLAENKDFFQWESPHTFDAVVSNPPYVGKNTSDALSKEVRDFEPHVALFGGEKGDEILSQWIPKMVEALKPSGLFLCEIGYDQETRARALAEETGVLTNIEILKDYSGHPRILKAFKKSGAS
jgi:release factor glutamine methyltransferase